MSSIQLVKAIKSLRPTAEFVMKEGDYSTIEWHILDGNPPSPKEVEVALEQIKNQEEQEEADRIAARASVEAKLAALGFTIDDLKALGL